VSQGSSRTRATPRSPARDAPEDPDPRTGRRWRRLRARPDRDGLRPVLKEARRDIVGRAPRRRISPHWRFVERSRGRACCSDRRKFQGLRIASAQTRAHPGRDLNRLLRAKYAPSTHRSKRACEISDGQRRHPTGSYVQKTHRVGPSAERPSYGRRPRLPPRQPASTSAACHVVTDLTGT